MKNVMLQMLAEFITSNYDMLKDDYNKLSAEEKSQYPTSIFFIGVFDRILADQHQNNLKEQNENKPKIITNESTIITAENKIITI
jgi:hypothetical protein